MGWGVNAQVTVNERQSGTPTLTHLAHSKWLLVAQKVWEGGEGVELINVFAYNTCTFNVDGCQVVVKVTHIFSLNHNMQHHIFRLQAKFDAYSLIK